MHKYISRGRSSARHRFGTRIALSLCRKQLERWPTHELAGSGTFESRQGDFAVLGDILQPNRHLPLNTDDTQRIRTSLLRRLLLVPSALLLLVGSVVVHFLYAAVPLDPTDWLLILLAVAGAGVSFAGYRMAANMATCLQLIDMETRQMRTQLIQAGKMAELGEMSTGIAHEINNPLQVMMSELALIHSIAEELAVVVPEHDAWKMTMLRESTEVIGHQIKRCSKITQGLLNTKVA